VLLASTASEFHTMYYAKDYSILFNSSKPKCSVVLPKNSRFLHESVEMMAFYVGDSFIEFLDYSVHLGHVITNQLTDNNDILKRRHDFVGQVNSVLCFA